MASPRFGKYFKHIEENLFNLGYSKAKAKLQSEDSDGNLIGWMNFSSLTSNAADLQFFIRFLPYEIGGLPWPDSMKTQLHSQGQFAQGPALVELVIENGPANLDPAAIERKKFESDLLHILRGQHGATTRLRMTDDLTNPGATLISSGALVTTPATWDSSGSLVGILPPYGRSTPGGTLA